MRAGRAPKGVLPASFSFAPAAERGWRANWECDSRNKIRAQSALQSELSRTLPNLLSAPTFLILNLLV